ncbi:MAG: type II toxin-antitoxin system HicB family antitoxin [Deltaproteobacteria bacterium]|nr:type II toxin-antitoxin system HicB family antitoxin [Deltaproteobacteria bacterium]
MGLEGSLMQFPIVIHKDEKSGYGVTVPDLPGCFSAGDTLEEAIESAYEAIACHIEGLLMDGQAIPRAASLEAHRESEDYKDGIWALAGVDVSRLSSTAKRVNITVPARVLAIIDEAAAREGQTRSALLTRAALSYVEQRSR